MIVKEYMNANPITLNPDEDVNKAFNLLLENRVRQAPVMKEGELVGIITDRDLRMAIVQNLKMNRLTVGLVMTKDPVTVTEDTKIIDAGKLISNGKFNAVPVIEESGKLKGMITTTDIIDYFISISDDNFGNIIPNSS